MFESSPQQAYLDISLGAEGPCAVAEFRDQRLSVQYALGGIAGVGLVATIGCLKMAGDAPIYFTAAGAVAAASLAALAFVYLRFGKPIVLRQTDEGLLMIRGAEEFQLPFDRLIGLTAIWTDVFRNNVYSHTQVRFEFHAEDAALSVMKYDSTATYGTVKYEELQTFQMHVASVVADRMGRTLQAEGRVYWTSRLTLLPGGVEFTKSAGAAPALVEFSRISRREVDQGLFKLAVDGDKKPLFAEKTAQLNFFPGLLLFEHLKEAADAETSPSPDEHVLVGAATER